MPTSVRETAMVAVLAKLDELVGWRLVRRNWPGLPHLDQLPAAILMDGGETARNITTCRLQVESDATIYLECRAVDTDAVGAELSNRIAEIKALLMADETLGGVLSRIRYVGCDEPVLDDQDGGSPVAATTLTFRLLYEHAEDSPYT